jgi:hypothetical protein
MRKKGLLLSAVVALFLSALSPMISPEARMIPYFFLTESRSVTMLQHEKNLPSDRGGVKTEKYT